MKLFKLKYLVGTMIAASLIGGVITNSVMAKDKSKLEAKAKITKAQAEKIALEKVPGGKIKEAELEEEDGVLVWSFDIAVAGSKKLQEVEVDANTGKIISDDDDDKDHQNGDQDEDDDEDDDKDGK